MAYSTVRASSNGAPAGYTAGPANQSQNCSACHFFHVGPGGVELLDAPRRYQAGTIYDLLVRVSDPEQAGAGFEISAENSAGHLGRFLIRDPVFTRNADNGGNSAPDIHYVTHADDGYSDSLDTWVANGGSYTYQVRWEAPLTDEGPVTFFVAGNAVNNATSIQGDRYYATWATARFARPGDADGDGDGDVDLRDAATLQRCFRGDSPAPAGDCVFVDDDGDGFVALNDLAAWINDLEGPVSSVPAAYLLADAVRGGQLYDRWWRVNGAAEPSENHPLYPASGPQAGSATFRCKECHGWDYKGVDGAYGSDPAHVTGLPGVYGTPLTPQELYDLLTADPGELLNGHNMDESGLNDGDVWDVVKFSLESVVDTDAYIQANGTFLGVAFIGQGIYQVACNDCHGPEGADLNFGTVADPVYLGDVVRANPWEFLHKTRFGHPGSSMPATDLLGWSVQQAAHLGAYCATLQFP